VDNIKGIVFLLESLITSGKKQWLSDNVIISGPEAIQLIQKLKEALDDVPQAPATELFEAAPELPDDKDIVNAQKVSFKIKQDANEYADGVLSRLQLLVTKLQKNVINVEHNILEGRKLIEQHQLNQNKGENHEA
tara:strand:- start:4198 stop:4602 length:405 start_codon:yes stop_codon:yes gene_type:complete